MSHSEQVDEARGESSSRRQSRTAGRQKPGAFAERTKKGNAKGNGKGVGSHSQSKVAKVGSISTKTRKGDKLCGAYNGKKGCTRDHRQCPQKALHRCGVITAEDGFVSTQTMGHRTTAEGAASPQQLDKVWARQESQKQRRA